MTDRPANIINLNKARKSRQRDAARRKADENAVKFGRPKALKRLEDTRAAKASHELDGKKRDPAT